MLTERAIRYVQWRLYICQLAMGTPMTWDRKSNKIVFPNMYLYFMTLSGFMCAQLFPMVHAVQIYLKNTAKDIPEEEGGPEDPDKEKHEMFAFATMVIGWGELGIGLSLSGVAYVAVTKNKEIIWLYNEIFEYNRKMLDFLKERNIGLDRKHKNTMKMGERIILGSCFLSVAVECLIMFTLLHPLEPTHVIVQEWLELKLEWRPILIPFLFVIFCAAQSGGNMVLIFCLLIESYSFLVTPILEDLTVEGINRKQGVRCTLETRYYGNLEDEEICNLYRTQRYLNQRINQVMSTIFISFHQIGLLACASVLLFFFVKFQDVIYDVGPLAIVIILFSLMAPLTISFFQSELFGTLVDISDEFKDVGLKLLPRKTMHRKFAYSCQTFFVEEAYPFFHYHKNTFLEFCAAALEHAINLMLW